MKEVNYKASLLHEATAQVRTRIGTFLSKSKISEKAVKTNFLYLCSGL